MAFPCRKNFLSDAMRWNIASRNALILYIEVPIVWRPIQIKPSIKAIGVGFDGVHVNP